MSHMRSHVMPSKNHNDVCTLSHSLTVDDLRNKPLPIPLELQGRAEERSGTELPRVSVSPAVGSVDEEASKTKDRSSLRSYLSRTSHLFRSSMALSSDSSISLTKLASTSPVSSTTSSSSNLSIVGSESSHRGAGISQHQPASRSETHLSVSSAAVERSKRTREPSAPLLLASPDVSSDSLSANVPRPQRSHSSFSFRKQNARKSLTWMTSSSRNIGADCSTGSDKSGSSNNIDNNNNSSSRSNSSSGNSNIDRKTRDPYLDRELSSSSRSTQESCAQNTTMGKSSSSRKSVISAMGLEKCNSATAHSDPSSFVSMNTAQAAQEGVAKKNGSSRPQSTKRFSFYDSRTRSKNMHLYEQDVLSKTDGSGSMSKAKAALGQAPPQSVSMLRGRSRSLEALGPLKGAQQIASTPETFIDNPRPSRVLSQRDQKSGSMAMIEPAEPPPLSKEVLAAREGTLARLTHSVSRRPSSAVINTFALRKGAVTPSANLTNDVARDKTLLQQDKFETLRSPISPDSVYVSADSSFSPLTMPGVSAKQKKEVVGEVDREADGWKESQDVTVAKEDDSDALSIAHFRAAQMSFELSDGFAGIGQAAMTTSEDVDEDISPASTATLLDGTAPPDEDEKTVETIIVPLEHSQKPTPSTFSAEETSTKATSIRRHKKSLSLHRILNPMRPLIRSRPSSSSGRDSEKRSDDCVDDPEPSNSLAEFTPLYTSVRSATASRRSSLSPSDHDAVLGSPNNSKSCEKRQSQSQLTSTQRQQKPPPVSYRGPRQDGTQQGVKECGDVEAGATRRFGKSSNKKVEEHRRELSLPNVTSMKSDESSTKRSSSIGSKGNAKSSTAQQSQSGHERQASVVSVAPRPSSNPPPRSSSRSDFRRKSGTTLESAEIHTQAPLPRKRAISKPSLSQHVKPVPKEAMIKRPSSALGDTRAQRQSGDRTRHQFECPETSSFTLAQRQPTLNIADDSEFLQALEGVRRAHQERIAKQTAESLRIEQMARLGMASRNRQGNKSLASRGTFYDANTTRDTDMIVSGASSLHTSPPKGITRNGDVPASPRKAGRRQRSSSADGRLDGPSGLQTRRSMRGERDPHQHNPWLGITDSDLVGRGNDIEVAPSALQLGVGRASGKLKDGAFINDDDWKKEVKALFVIRELVLTERSYAKHLEALLQAIRDLPCYRTGSSSSTTATRRKSTSGLISGGVSVFTSGSQSNSSSPNNSVKGAVGPAPLHIQMMRSLLPQLISLSHSLANRIDEDPTAAGVGSAFRLVGVQMEASFVAWSAVAQDIMHGLRKTESAKSKSSHKIGLLTLIKESLNGADMPVQDGIKSVPTSPTKAHATLHPTSSPPPLPADPLKNAFVATSSVEEVETMRAAASSSVDKRAAKTATKRRSTFSSTPPTFLRSELNSLKNDPASVLPSASPQSSFSSSTTVPLCDSPEAMKKHLNADGDYFPAPTTSSASSIDKVRSSSAGRLPPLQQQHPHYSFTSSSNAGASLGRRAIDAVSFSSSRSPIPSSKTAASTRNKFMIGSASSSRIETPASMLIDPKSQTGQTQLQQQTTSSPASTVLKKLGPLDVAIMPTQRIPRYLLLLKDLIANTPPQSLSHVRIQRSLDSTRKVAALCDAASNGIGRSGSVVSTRSGSAWR